MTTKPRAPMKFDLDAKPPTAEAAARPKALDDSTKREDAPATADRQQVGARVTKATYRKLKAMAALRGEAVQTLVEQAIDDFLARQAI